MKELTYTKKGDYQIPDLVMDGAAELASLGRYGRMRRKFLEEHHHGTYISMLLTGSLPGHLQETEQEAQEQMESLMSQMMEAEGVDEEGFQYPLKNAALTPDVPLGVSNHILEQSARITVRKGALAVGWELPPLD